jgi:hypothetical protein
VKRRLLEQNENFFPIKIANERRTWTLRILNYNKSVTRKYLFRPIILHRSIHFGKDMLNNYEGTVLFWLLSSSNEQVDLSVPIASLQSIINDTRVFFDRDQCIEDIASITDLTIFLVLGPTRSDLLPILYTFIYLRHIYLSEPHEYAQHTSQVRGVFLSIEQLLPQLTKDVRLAQRFSTHLIVTHMGDPIQPHRTIADLQTPSTDFKFKNALIDIILHAPKPPVKNFHKLLVDEWRLVYGSNVAQMKYIDEFEKNYDPSNAIYWYTRETSLYKMVNVALRTENIVVILTLWTYIQDMFQHLQRLHDEQRKMRTSTYEDITDA